MPDLTRDLIPDLKPDLIPDLIPDLTNVFHLIYPATAFRLSIADPTLIIPKIL
jgi:hypothetical protein